jgi:tRNA (cmo5U34)-methyltransferase
MGNPQRATGWEEADSRRFLDYGRYFVPERERQIGIIGDLIPPPPDGALLVELCSGEGLLSRALLERFPGCRMLALDGSAEMRARTRATCGGAAERLTVAAFDLAARDWRAFAEPPHTIVSSLAIHHLDGGEKRALFRDLAGALAGGGVLVIADIVRPPDARGLAVAAQQWDEAVRAGAGARRRPPGLRRIPAARLELLPRSRRRPH